MFLLTIVVIFIFVIIAVALIKPKKISENEQKILKEKREIKEKSDFEAEKRKKIEEKRLLDEAKVKAEADERRLLEEQKAAHEEAEERKKIEDKRLLEIAKEEDERQRIAKEEKEKGSEDEKEIAKKPLEEVIKGKLWKSRPLTMHEQPMFTKLRNTLEPDYVVLAQVSFSSILWTWSNGVRNRFNRKIVDFVICDKGFNVVAVVELDDLSHKGKEERDNERDLLLNEAGITVLRYKQTPESWKIREDIKGIKL